MYRLYDMTVYPLFCFGYGELILWHRKWEVICIHLYQLSFSLKVVRMFLISERFRVPCLMGYNVSDNCRQLLGTSCEPFDSAPLTRRVQGTCVGEVRTSRYTEQAVCHLSEPSSTYLPPPAQRPAGPGSCSLSRKEAVVTGVVLLCTAAVSGAIVLCIATVTGVVLLCTAVVSDTVFLCADSVSTLWCCSSMHACSL